MKWNLEMLFPKKNVKDGKFNLQNTSNLTTHSNNNVLNNSKIGSERTFKNGS